GLREPHRRVRMLPAADRERFARRYLAICDLAKRDPDRAAIRMEAFLADLNSESDTPGAQKNASGD
ncbi:hypothetical protein, partial [Nonomuraea sp. bgisy101]|uniref:hypothetical protein n=1 Tax=Nonomuraea sp. bgisy101 TaxID=3413784 RepID=UPI003D75B5C7